MKKILKDGKYDYVISCHFPLDLFIYFFKKYSYFIREIHISKLSMYQQLNWRQRCLVKFEHRYILKNFNRVITLTKEDIKEWKLKNISYIYNPLTFFPNNFSACENKKIISIGRLEKQKGFDILIDIFIQYPEWKLNIYGEGSEKWNLERKIKQLNLEKNIILRGKTSTIYDELIKSSIYVMSSRYEGFPLVLLEAQSCGLPIVSFNCPYGPSEIINDTEDGFLCEVGEIEKFREKTLELIISEEKRKTMGKRARENVSRFSKDKIMSKWKKIFENNLINK